MELNLLKAFYYYFNLYNISILDRKKKRNLGKNTGKRKKIEHVIMFFSVEWYFLNLFSNFLTLFLVKRL